ncbi:MAG: hypothetical protein PHH04_06840 [Thomasclavelia sp.]|nr:hypothetical protein [Thomasclavelia sp.]
MTLIKLMNKYGLETKISKTDLYQELEKHKDICKRNNYTLDIKSEDDLFKAELIVNGLLLKEELEGAYNKYVSLNYDTFEYINYEEKRNIFQKDIMEVLKDKQYFIDSKSHKEIYIPFYELFVNERIVDDYLVLTLKQYENYVKTYKISNDNITSLYGLQPFNSSLSCLENIGHDDEFTYYYFKPTRSVYIYNTNDYSFYNKLTLVGNKIEKVPTSEEARELIAVLLSNEDDKVFVEELFSKEFINEKTYKKILKKVDKK